MGAWAAGLTATFWLPAMWYRDTLTTSSIAVAGRGSWWSPSAARGPGGGDRDPPDQALAALVAALTIGALLLAVAPTLLTTVPRFHYYRLAAPATLLMLAVAAHVASAPAPTWARRTALVLAALLPAAALGAPWLAPREGRLAGTDVDLGPAPDPAAPYGRQWTVENRRAADLGLDSLAAAESDGQRRSVKGLYWESARDHTLLTSYLATLHSPSVVLDHVAYDGLSCEVQACLTASFARAFNVRRIAYQRGLPAARMPPTRLACWREFDRAGAIGALSLSPVGAMRDGATTYDVFELATGVGGPRLEVAEPLAPAQLATVGTTDRRALLAAAMDDAVRACTANRRPGERVYLPPAALAALRPHVVGVRVPTRDLVIDARREGDGRLVLDVPSAHPVLFWLKLSALPGLVVRDEAGHRVPTAEALPGMIVVGRGRLTVSYERPLGVRLGEGVTLAALLAAAAALAWPWLRRRRRPAPPG
ncbi:MAG: hypothetical protein R2939_09435 [Kofleriaceae bacterium]